MSIDASLGSVLQAVVTAMRDEMSRDERWAAARTLRQLDMRALEAQLLEPIIRFLEDE